MKTTIQRGSRKHVNQMTLEERHRLLIEIQMVDFWKFVNYSNKRISNRQIKKGHVLDAINNGILVEYHLKDGCSRLLFRSRKSFKGNNVCVVVEPKSKVIVTAFYVSKKDHHKTLDWSEYNNGLDVLKLFKENA